MMKILQSIPNISEGRNKEILKDLKDIILRRNDIKMVEFLPDKDHNRTVISIIGSPNQVVEATLQLSLYAIEKIDMTKHRGKHPRIGAVDVVPFAPVCNISNDEIIKISRNFGRLLAKNAKIPVYYYEDSAIHSWRKSLPVIRKGEYEALEEKLKMPDWEPDAGKAVFVPKAGASIVGTRFPVIAFNVNLGTTNLKIAKKIANSVRFSSGGFRFVKAIGLELKEKGLVQVSMNLTDYRQTPIHRVLETIKAEAIRYGLSIQETEIVGTIPMDAIIESMKYYFQLKDFEHKQIVEKLIINYFESNEQEAR
jgi:glutamate formiminotransferase